MYSFKLYIWFTEWLYFFYTCNNILDFFFILCVYINDPHIFYSFISSYNCFVSPPHSIVEIILNIFSNVAKKLERYFSLISSCGMHIYSAMSGMCKRNHFRSFLMQIFFCVDVVSFDTACFVSSTRFISV